MAKNKKSFVLYCDLLPMVMKMPDDKAGNLFKHILNYVNDNDPDEPDDLIISIAFEPIKQQLKRDLDKYKAAVERNKTNGKKGGRPKTTGTKTNQKNPVGYIENQGEPKKADTDNDIGTGIKKKNTKKKTKFEKPTTDEILEYVVEENFNVDAGRFFDHYESNGWKVGGKSPMKNWRAAVRNWHRKKTEENANANNQKFDNRGRGQRVADRLDEIARKDIEENGLEEALDGGFV